MMTTTSRGLAILCIVSQFVVVVGCGGSDEVIQSRQVSVEEAAAAIAEAIPLVFEFGPDMADLLEVVSAGKSGDPGRRVACRPIPGLESDFFCTDPTGGEICPINGMISQWLFSNCTQTGTEPGFLDGRVTVTESGNAFELDFDLDVDGASLSGLLLVERGEPCVTIAYSGFGANEGDTSTTVDGTNTICPEGLSGTVNVSIDAMGIPKFLSEIVLFQGIPTIVVLDPSTSTPLYSCTYNPLGETVQCFSYGET